MNEGYTRTILAIFYGIVLGAIVATCVVRVVVDLKWKADAVSHGAAEYDRSTGAWRWLNTPITPEELDAVLESRTIKE